MAAESSQRGGRPVGLGLPESLAHRIASGALIRTAHRGAPRVAPGNTLRSILAALDFGVDLVEIDLHHSSDGRLVLWHDDSIPHQGQSLEIESHSFDRLSEAVADELGEELIDLEHALAVTAGRAGLMIDLKSAGLSAHIARLVVEARFSPAVVCGAFWDDLRSVRRLAPEIGISLTLDQGWTEVRGPRIEEIDTPAITAAWPLVDKSFVERMHEQGIAVLVWTVDELALMRKLIDSGVDGITSNRSELFGELEGLAGRSEPGE